MKKVFEITRTETSTQRVYIEADSKEEAMKYAESEPDVMEWRENQDVEYVYDEGKEITDPENELSGVYVERLNGRVVHGDKINT